MHKPGFLVKPLVSLISRCGMCIALGYAWLSPVACHAQGFTWATQIARTGPAPGGRIAVNSGGETYVAGGFEKSAQFGSFSLTNRGASDFYLAKYSAQGDVLWVKHAGGTGSDGWNDIALDTEGYVYVIGSFQGTIEIEGRTLTATGSVSMGTVNNWVLAKYSPAGSLVWLKQSGGDSGGVGLGVALDDKKNVLCTGSYDFAFFNGPSIIIEKRDPAGNVVWQQRLYGLPNYNWAQQGKSIKADHSGNVYVTGQFATEVTFGNTTLASPGNYPAVFVTKLDPNGNFLWAQQPTNADVTPFHDGTSIALDASGSVLLAGTYSGSMDFGTNQLPVINSQTYAGYVAKCDRDGNFFWAKKVTDNEGNAKVVTSDASNSVYVTGFSYPSQVFVSKLDPDGNSLWSVVPNKTGSSSGSGLAVRDSENISLLTWASQTISLDAFSFTNKGGGDLFLGKIAEKVPPAFTSSPRSTPEGFALGANFTLSAVVRSLYPVTYQWQLEGTNLPGATNVSFSITNAHLSDQGRYWLVASNMYGSTTSSVATLTVYFRLASRVAGSGRIDISPVMKTNQYPATAVLTLTAIPEPGFSFTGWSGDLQSSTNPFTLMMTSNMFVTASFSDALTNIAIDNLDREATFTGNWMKYQTNYFITGVSSVQMASAIYRPNIVVSGFYNVYVWYPQYVNYSAKAPWTVSSESGITTALVDQRTNGNSWVQIASAQYFAAGTNGYVQLSNNTGEATGKYVVADWVRFRGWPPPSPKISGLISLSQGMQIPLNAVTGLTYTLEASTNLADWVPLDTILATTNEIQFFDPNSTNYSQRFYRGRVR